MMCVHCAFLFFAIFHLPRAKCYVSWCPGGPSTVLVTSKLTVNKKKHLLSLLRTLEHLLLYFKHQTQAKSHHTFVIPNWSKFIGLCTKLAHLSVYNTCNNKSKLVQYLWEVTLKKTMANLNTKYWAFKSRQDQFRSG